MIKMKMKKANEFQKVYFFNHNYINQKKRPLQVFLNEADCKASEDTGYVQDGYVLKKTTKFQYGEFVADIETLLLFQETDDIEVMMRAKKLNSKVVTVLCPGDVNINK